MGEREVSKYQLINYSVQNQMLEDVRINLFSKNHFCRKKLKKNKDQLNCKVTFSISISRLLPIFMCAMAIPCLPTSLKLRFNNLGILVIARLKINIASAYFVFLSFFCFCCLANTSFASRAIF